MVWKTHEFFGASLLPTHDYKTSQAAHQLLEKILKRKCEEIKKIDYGLQILPETDLKIANTKEFHWLLQPELKAIKDGLTYIENKQGIDSDEEMEEDDKIWRYRGYINEQGQLHGVGIKKYN